MNPLKMWAIYRNGNRIGNLLQEAQMGKVPWKSKTLWFNVLLTAGELLQILPVPPGTALIVSGVINGALRLITGQPITFNQQK